MSTRIFQARAVRSRHFGSSKSQTAGDDVTQAFMDALAASAPAIRAQLKLSDTGSSFFQGEREAGEEKALHLRRRLHAILSHNAGAVNVQHELLKMSQGLPVSAGARDVLDKVLKKGPAGTSSLMQGGPAIVVDNGSGMIKAGFAGDASPKAVFPNVLAQWPKDTAKNPVKQGGMPPLYVGDEVEKMKSVEGRTSHQGWNHSRFRQNGEDLELYVQKAWRKSSRAASASHRSTF